MRAFPLLLIIYSNDGDLVSRPGGQDMIIGSSQASLMISALKRKQGTDLLSAPRVTVMDGQSATITVAQEFIYPIDYELAEPPSANALGLGGGGGGIWGNCTSSRAKQHLRMLHPQMSNRVFERSGVVLNVTPTIEKYNSINLRLNPKVTEFDGFIEYGGYNHGYWRFRRCWGTSNNYINLPGQIMPIFSVRKVDTQVSIFDGATVIIGGLTREEVKTVNDKIPVLGNLPLIGKLFQSNAESYQKRNLLIFVSASIVSKGGSPVREVIQNIGPQSIFKDPVILTPTGTIRRTFKNEDEEN